MIDGNANKKVEYNYDSLGRLESKNINLATNDYLTTYTFKDGQGGTTTSYHLLGDKVTFETSGTDEIYYTYDSNSSLISMNLNGSEYYYIRNGQGDIIGLHDNTGTQVVSYTYDTWGKIIGIDGTLASTVGEKNPYRYRGYRYDSETGLYYLQSRYYNAEWGRFINADALGGKMGILLSHNVFTYCMNNPVNMAVPEGNIAWWIVGGAIGAVVGGITGAIVSYKTTGKVDWKYVAGEVAAGALIGVGLGYAAEVAYTAITAVAAANADKITNALPSNGRFARVMPDKIAEKVASGQSPLSLSTEAWITAADEFSWN